ncbi:FAD-binding oxidoreductase [Geodermatophilus poikilotrophus]|uniref:Glycolate oxidase FAD binding subunit n=1 Tax=Geodermatophilus poikilotrophus TaxID=1333667 RepID=A0A1I0HQU3_9ACTN|nr:FAD-binding oxidoreductase [Geodermatophilus poikilotrophus]SET86406.1 glycolate oxidase FAD binding subunit [Geodermatophilus poikilotrophus]
MTAVTAPPRPGDAGDAVGGVVPREVVRPGSVEEVAEVMRASAADGRSVVPVGGRSKLTWAAPPESCDLLVDLTGLDRVVEHVAGDLTVVAEAGVRLADLQAQVGRAGQLLGLDPPEDGATLGGVVSANASGPRRLRYGTTRDLLIGITVVLADGTVAHAGGKVVKNVAGYDLGKLFTGAHGTLGVVASTTWRLHPVPPARRVVTLELPDAAAAGPLATALARSTLTPSAVELVGSAGGAARLVVLFESIAESVAGQARAAVDLLGGGEESEDLPGDLGRRPGGADDVLLRLAYAPASLSAVLAALPAGTAVTAHAATGVSYAAVPAAEAADALPRLRAAIAPHDGTAVVLRAPDAVRDRLDHWGPVGDSLDLMRRVKERFDPERRMSPGRFVGGV